RGPAVAPGGRLSLRLGDGLLTTPGGIWLAPGIQHASGHGRAGTWQAGGGDRSPLPATGILAEGLSPAAAAPRTAAEQLIGEGTRRERMRNSQNAEGVAPGQALRVPEPIPRR